MILHKLSFRHKGSTNQITILVVITLLTIGFSYYLISTAKYVDLAAIQQQDDALAAPLDNQHLITQSFIAKRSGLSSIKIQVLTIADTSIKNQPYRILLVLYDNNHNQIAQKHFSTSPAKNYTELVFSFPPQHDSYDRQYSFEATTDAPPNTITLLGSHFDSYKNGSLHINNQITDHDLTFTTYAKPSFLQLFDQTLAYHKRLLFLLVFSLLSFVLGFPLYSIFSTEREGGLESIIKSICLGVSILPLLFYVLSATKITLSRNNLIILVIFATGGTLYYLTTKKVTFSSGIEKGELTIFGTMAMIALFSRLSQIDDIFVPNWVDGLSHQRVLENTINSGLLPINLLYHLGFHTNVMVAHKLFESPLPETTLVYGQWLSIVSGLSFYLLARRLLGYGTAPLFTTSFYWFISPFPAYLVDWSRYPILQGMLLLPLVILCFFDQRAKKEKGMTALFVAGLLLSHYGIGLTLTIIIFLSYSWWVLRSMIVGNREIYMKNILIPIVIITLTLPATTIFVEVNKDIIYQIIQKYAWKASFTELAKLLQLTFTHGGWIMWSMGILGAIIGFLSKRSKVVMSVSFGIAYLILSTIQEYVIGTSAFGMINNLILLSIPLCLLSGLAFKAMTNSIGSQYKRWILACVLFLSLAGGYNIAGIINPSTVLFTRADIDAMHWIRSNTESKSKFLISSFDWHNNIYVPGDGGGWIQYLAERQTIYIKKHTNSYQLDQIISDERIDYIYIGSNSHKIKLLLINNPTIKVVYKNDHIEIFRVIK